IVTGKTYMIGILLGLVAAVTQAIGLVLARDALQEIEVLLGTLIRITPALIILLLLRRQSGDYRRHWKLLLTDKKSFYALFIAAFTGTFIGLIFGAAGSKYAKAGVTAALTSTYPIWVIPIAI